MNALIILAFWGVIMMFSGIITKEKKTIRTIAILGILTALVVNIMEMYQIKIFHVDTTGMLYFNKFGLFTNSIFLVGTLLYFILSGKDINNIGQYSPDYFALLFFIHCGIILTISFQSLLILFLGIEIISIPLYILTGAEKKNLKSNEAALKYFLMGSFSTGIMLLGIALIYGGTDSFSAAPLSIMSVPDANGVVTAPSAYLVGGMFVLLFSMSFKVSVAPFHFWTPDVYDGAPTVFTSFMATVVKGAIFIGFIRLFGETFGQLQAQWVPWVAILVAATLFIGNITAVFQQSVKRMLAYSSIAQAGFMLLALFANNTTAVEGLLLYATAYMLASIGIFAVLAKVQDYTFEGFNGLAKKEPVLAAVITVCLLSLAGIPLTAGFLAKMYMIKATLAHPKGMWLAIFAIVMAAVSVSYYFKLIQAMYFKEGDVKFTTPITGSFKFALIALAVIIVLLGVFPNLLLYWFYF